MRVVVGSDTSINSPVFVAADGETATDADATPTCTVTDGAGSALTAPTVAKVTTGIYAAALTAATHTDTLDTLTLTWTGEVDSAAVQAVQTVEVAGSVYAPLSTLRQVQGLDNPDKFPGAQLIAAREEFEALAEQYLGVACVPRCSRETIIGTGQCRLVLGHPEPRTVRSLTIDGTDVDTDTLTLEISGWIERDAAFPYGSKVEVVYEHGFTAPPGPVVRACVEYVRSTVLQSVTGLPRNTISESIDGGSVSVRYSTADWSAGRPTGLLNVDAALNQAPNYRIPGLA